MAKLIDASGPIYDGMWNYETPCTKFKLVELEQVKWVKEFKPRTQGFEGFCMLTGNYIDGPSHAFGLEKEDSMDKLPLNKIFNVDAYVLKFDLSKLGKEGNRNYITLKDIKNAEKDSITDEAPIILATGWGTHWDKPDFLTHSWFLKKDAAEYIASKRPLILGIDTPYIDNLENEQKLWAMLYESGINLLAPLINIEKISKFKVKLFVAPLNILNTTGLPCRTVIIEE